MSDVLSTLKDFQRRTADAVFQRLFLDADSSHRHLVADEVGLGKTLVARGVVAHAIDRLWSERRRIDIVYVCSNRDIARQNISRLNVTEDKDSALPTRLTYLAARRRDDQRRDFRDNQLNFISLTPGTSFDRQGTQLGEVSERAILLLLLERIWGVAGAAAKNVFQGNAGVDRFRDLIDSTRNACVLDEEVVQRFDAAVSEAEQAARAASTRGVRDRFDELCDLFPRAKDNIPVEHRQLRNAFVGEMRMRLGRACIGVLSPDLVILDEFQRFKHLLSKETEAGELAHELFDYADHESKARVLLLSATPYKMYTIAAERGEEDHHEDFLRTVRFLLNSDAGTASVKDALQAYRDELLAQRGRSSARLLDLRELVESHLRPVISRTERLAVTNDRNGMLREVQCPGPVLPVDLHAYRAVQGIARRLEAPDVLEMWKSAPYLLNFMTDYQFKASFMEALADPDREIELRKDLEDGRDTLLPRAVVDRQDPIEPQNARLRALLGATTGLGAWQLLWLPPTARYYELAGVFSNPALAGFSKQLVFSSWKVVPKVISALLSYEAERLASQTLSATRGDVATAEEGRQSLLLRFGKDQDGRLSGMPNFSLLYPSTFLAERCDPLALAATLRSGADRPRLDEVRQAAKIALSGAIADLTRSAPTGGAKDESWYWAAPVLLDLQHDRSGTEQWLQHVDLAAKWAGEGDDDADSNWAEHVRRLVDVTAGKVALGPPPEDLVDVLAELAIAAPATCALRSLARVVDEPDGLRDSAVRDAAAAIGWAFRGYFNRPHAIAIVRGLDAREPYWLRALQYCAYGALQATLDEYAHVLRESLGLIRADAKEISVAIAKALRNVLSLRPSSLKVDFFDVSTGGVSPVRHSSRQLPARFALPLAESEDEETPDASRLEKVKDAFNSPFWPFVVASTSIGQEGLDFHPYCHVIVHWNLPTNPVDMEQREGRVHRYKGHAVRKNVAHVYASELLSATGDPWAHLFSRAAADRDETQNDLVPYWVFPVEGGAKIERHIVSTPLSREQLRLDAIRRTMALYRLVFGQPRQDDMVQYLLEQKSELSADELAKACEGMRIDLTPR